MRDLVLSGAAVGAFALSLLLLERLFPLRRAHRPLAGRLRVNLIFTAVAFATLFFIVRPASETMLGWTGRNAFGLLQWATLPSAVRPFVALLLMDLSFYWWHRANHRIGMLWRFHNVHHTDPDLDVTTALRFHFGELAFSAGFRILQLALIGISARSYLLYEILFQAGNLFHHSNLRLPMPAERLLVRIIVTPRMHGIHHSQVPEETNSNYASVFSLWDQLHRTLRLNIPQAAVEIGVPAYARQADNRPWNALTMPFRHQRRYWCRDQGPAPRRETTTGDAGRLAE